LALSI